MTASEEQSLVPNIKLSDFSDEIKANYLVYAEYVIRDRALPDVRDGLKPVHRRILWSMWDIGCRSNSHYKKCARVVGDVIAKYHPHGDSSVYSAMVRMAQPFMLHNTLVDGKGNFGSIDNPSGYAAYRYCLPSGTPILLENGDYKNIEQIQVGDMVLTHRGSAKPVERLLPMEHEELIRIELETGFIVYASPNHPFLVWRDEAWKWVRAEFLVDTDCLCQLVGKGDGLTEADNVDPATLTAEIDSCNALFETKQNTGNMKLKPIKIKSLQRIKNPDKENRTWDLQVQDNHTYLVGTSKDNHVVSHNTECRLSKFSEDVYFADIGEDLVDFAKNYDGHESEPVVLPARIPMLLCTAPSGIAVGMATNIPPHNLTEVCDATILRIRNEDEKKILKSFLGPDYPLGGLVKKFGSSLYGEGKGSTKTRCEAEFESDGKNKYIIIRSVPYSSSKEDIINDIAKAVKEGEVEGVKDIRDESDRSVRLCIEVERKADQQAVLNALYKCTRLQSSMSINAVSICNEQPRTVGLLSILDNFIEFRQDAVRRRAKCRLDKLVQRQEIVKAILKVSVDPKTLLSIVTKANSLEEITDGLKKKFKLNDRQANYVAEMPVRRMSNLDVDRHKEEDKTITKETEEQSKVLSNKKYVNEIIINEVEEIKAKYGHERKTYIVSDFETIAAKDTVKQEDVAMMFMSDGTVKATPISNYRLQKRRGQGVSGVKVPDGVIPIHVAQANTHDDVMVFTDKGNRYRLSVHLVPAQERTRKPQPVSTYIPEIQADENVVGVTKANLEDDDVLLTFTKDGLLRKLCAETVNRTRDNTYEFYPVEDGGLVLSVVVAKENDDLVFLSKLGQVHRISLSNVRPIKSRLSKGVKSFKLKKRNGLQDEPLSISTGNNDSQLLVVTKKGIGKRTPLVEYETKKGRCGQGIRGVKLEKDDEIVFGEAVKMDEEASLFIITNHNTAIRLRFVDTPEYSRSARGSRLKKLKENEFIASVAVE